MGNLESDRKLGWVPSEPQRKHHIDALRVSAILLLIPYHAARYVQKGTTDSPIVDAVVWFVHTWHMPLFFAISGYLAASALRRSSAFGQARGRLKRLGIPLLIGMITVVPLANLLVIASAQLRPRSQNLPDSRNLELANIFSLNPRHLWFLAYLLMISLIVIVVRSVALHVPAIGDGFVRGFQWLVARPFAFLPFALATGSLLLLKSGWAAGGDASSSLVPVPALLLYFTAFFGFGALLAGREELVRGLERGAWLRLGAGVALAVPVFLLFYDNSIFTGNVGVAGSLLDGSTPRIVGLFAVGIVGWLTMLGIWGVIAKYVTTESSVLRYLADASFWIYLIHIPFLIILQSTLAEADVWLPLRYVLTVTGTVLLSVGTYALFVRRTPIGTWLHGKRPRRPKPVAAPQPSPT